MSRRDRYRDGFKIIVPFKLNLRQRFRLLFGGRIQFHATAVSEFKMGSRKLAEAKALVVAPTWWAKVRHPLTAWRGVTVHKSVTPGPTEASMKEDRPFIPLGRTGRYRAPPNPSTKPPPPPAPPAKKAAG